MSSRPPNKWIVSTGIALGISMLVIVLSADVFQFGLFQRLELAAIDYRFLYRGPNPSVRDSSHVIIVEISEESVRSLPERFPWPRDYYARLVRNLYRAGARAVGIDLIFDSPDSHGAQEDSSLREAIRSTGITVLAGKREQDAEQYVERPQYRDYGNIFFSTDSSIGLVNIRADADGIYRFYNPYFLVSAPGDTDVAVPTLGFAVLNRAFGLAPFTTPVDEGSHFLYAGRSIPKYDPASYLINFYGPNGTFKHIRFHDVIDDETFTTVDEQATGEETNTFSDPDYGYLYDGTFKDKIVLVGVTVPEYKDLFPVSTGRGLQRGDNQMYGVEIHANVIENVLRNDFLHVQGPGTEIPEIILLVLVTFLITASFRGRTRQVLVEVNCFLFVTIEILVVGGLSVWLFNHANVVMKVVSPMLAILAGYIGSTAYNLVSERRQRLLIKTMFSTYVNPSVVESLLNDPGKLRLGGERKELTVLFSDIAGFTTMAQSMEPEHLVALLNEYLDVMSTIIFKHDGTLDKYEGDAIMAFWGAPIPQENHALYACKAALAMRNALVTLNQRWEAQGRPSFGMRVGVHTGEMVVGNMGSTEKFAYTVIGDSVNLASRLEGANKEYHTSIMVSRRTYDLVKEEILGRELDHITVKGRSESVEVYELVGLREDVVAEATLRFLEVYKTGMQFYHERKWQAAWDAFEEALRLKPDDFPSQVHCKRARNYAKHPDILNSDIVVLREK